MCDAVPQQLVCSARALAAVHYIHDRAAQQHEARTTLLECIGVPECDGTSSQWQKAERQSQQVDASLMWACYSAIVDVREIVLGLCAACQRAFTSCTRCRSLCVQQTKQRVGNTSILHDRMQSVLRKSRPIPPRMPSRSRPSEDVQQHTRCRIALAALRQQLPAFTAGLERPHYERLGPDGVSSCRASIKRPAFTALCWPCWPFPLQNWPTLPSAAGDAHRCSCLARAPVSPAIHA